MSDSVDAATQQEQRNLVGWYLFAALAILMIGTQMASYLNRSPSLVLMRKEIEEQLQTQVKTESLPGAKPVVSTLASAERKLEPKLAADAETTLLYAAVLTEEHKPIELGRLNALRNSKDPGYLAAYKIFSSPTLDKATAASLANQIPQTTFLYRLVVADAYEKAGDTSPRKKLAGDGGLGSTLLLGGAFAILLLGGLALLFAYSGARSQGLLIPKGLALRNLSLADTDRVVLRSAQILVGFLAAAIFVAGFVPKSWSDFASYAVAVGVVLCLARVPVGGKQLSWHALGVTKENLGRNILWGVGGAVANLPIIALMTYLGNFVFSALPTPEHPVTVDLTSATSPWVILKYLVIASFFVPIIEETMFRGTLFPAVASVLKSPLWAGVITSVLFAAIHPTGIPAWPGLAAIGGMSCFLAYQTKSLVPSIVMHAVHNCGVLVFTLLLFR